MFSDLSSDDQFDELGMHLDVPFVPTDERVIQVMLEMAMVDADDVLFDLGSGDGRIVVAAAHEYGARAVGVEIDAGRVAVAEAYAVQMGVEHRVCFVEDNLFDADFSPATVVTLYLLHGVNLDLRPRLINELRPGTRIVSHAFDMGDWKPDRRKSARGISIYLWVIPAQVAGSWHWRTAEGRQYRVELEQRYQQLRGKAWIDDEPAQLKAVLWGDLLELIIQRDGDELAESIILHCRDDHLLVVSENQKGIIAYRSGSE